MRILFSVLIPFFAFAQFGPDPLALAKYLSLTEGQIAQWDQLKSANRQELADRARKRSNLNVEFSRLLSAAVLDEALLGENQAALVQLDRDDAVSARTLTERMLAVLDAGQRLKLNTLAEAQSLGGLVRDAECQGLLTRPPVFIVNGFVSNACPDDFFEFSNPAKKNLSLAGAEAVVAFPSVVIRYLELSPAQVESLSVARLEYARAQAAKQAERQEMVTGLFGREFNRPVLDPAAIGKLVADIARLDRSFRVSDEGHVRKLRQGLNEGQVAKLDALAPAMAIAANEGPVRCAGFFTQRWGSSSFFWGPSLIEDPYRTTGCIDPRGIVSSYDFR